MRTVARPLVTACILLGACNDAGGGADTDDDASGSSTAGVEQTGGADDRSDSTSADTDGGATSGETGADETGSDDSGGEDDGISPLCGNGELDAEEDCDDGNTNAGDWCTDACEVATCGDGILWPAAETCDDGNTDPDDGCSPQCGLDTCGDGVLDPGEQCDVGPSNGTQGASCSMVCVSAGVAFSPTRGYRLEESRNIHPGIPLAIELGDLNLDGVLDAVVGFRGVGGASLAYGFGGGSFWTPFFVETPGLAEALLSGDLDGDGRADVVQVATVGQLEVRSFLAQGRGVSLEIDAERSLPSAADISLVDATGDDVLDLLAVRTAQDQLIVIEGNGDGSFGAQITIPTVASAGGAGPLAAAVCDLSGDGIPDLLAVTSGGDLVSALGMGDGAFAPATVASISNGELVDVVAVDLNGDGRDDVVAVAPQTNEIVVVESEAAGQLGSPNDFQVAGERPVAIVAAELDGDGEPELIVAEAESDSLSVFHALPNSVSLDLPVAVAAPLPTTANSDRSLLAADFNEDGLSDVLLDSVSSTVLLFVSDGAGSLSVPRQLPRTQSCCSEVAASVSDFNDDGHLDVALGSTGGFEIHAGDGEGGILAAVNTPSPGAGDRAHVRVGQLDGDGIPDLVLATGSSQFVAYGDNRAGYLLGEDFPAELIGARAIDLADLDGDGLDDRVGCAVIPNDAAVFWVSPSAPDILPYTVQTSGGSCAELRVADVTGDGLLDVMIGDQLSVALGPQDFSAPATIPGLEDFNPFQFDSGDFDGDGHTDLVFGDGNSEGRIAVVRSLGGGAFDVPLFMQMEGDADTDSVAVGDFNGDLVLDIAATGNGMPVVMVAIGFGNGEFSDPQLFDLPFGWRAIAANDLDGDGIDDLVTVDGGDAGAGFSTTQEMVVTLSLGHTVL